MSNSVRFTIKPLPTGIIYVLQVRKSCEAAVAESWLADRGIQTTFKLRGWWYEASWQDSPAAQEVAPLLQARASEER
ncbi:MAG: hypothetical protein HC827_24135 [Cyanobacteria bacterium RM1_2_2]|nr:hypothetical protein [Cyanobacteria bacterium RM1_2_2]